LAVACPELSVTLVESIGKKAKFLALAVEHLGLQDRVRVINDRAESLCRVGELRESFLAGTARAVGPVDVAAELTLPLLRVGGFLLLQKSRAQLDDELTRASQSLPVLGADGPRVVVPDAEALGKQHVILVLQKNTTTACQYPRSPAAIKRHPLGGTR
jgi:16S rRNA (guanine527-N7)-methyltransferase